MDNDKNEQWNNDIDPTRPGNFSETYNKYQRTLLNKILVTEYC